MTPLAPVLANRFGARHYSGASISVADAQSLLEAARWAPSSINEQPWAFMVAMRQDEAAFNALLGCILESNQVWAKDAAIAVQATSLGLQAREMGGIDADKARALYQVPETHEITSALAIGVPGEVTEYLGKRVRKGLGSFVFEGVWGKTVEWLG